MLEKKHHTISVIWAYWTSNVYQAKGCNMDEHEKDTMANNVWKYNEAYYTKWKWKLNELKKEQSSSENEVFKHESRFWERHACTRFTMFECLQVISLSL